MRVHGLQAPHRVGSPHGPTAHDGTIVTERVNEMWGTDLTTTLTVKEGTATVFVAVDHCSAEGVGIHAAKEGNRFEALEPIHQGVREYCGPIGKGVAAGLSLRHDHGSAYMSDHFQDEIRFLGLESSPAFVRGGSSGACGGSRRRSIASRGAWTRPRGWSRRRRTPSTTPSRASPGAGWTSTRGCTAPPSCSSG